MHADLEPVERLRRALLDAAIPSGTRIVLAVSGGSDSVALAVTAAAVRTETGWKLVIAHVNHGLRGEEAHEDERLVKQLAAELAIPFEIRTVDVAQRVRQQRLSIEAAARTLRYDALHDIRVARQADFILTAHTEDDQTETVLLNLLRGTGLDGLAGIPAHRDTIVRPFLSLPHATILGALQELGQPYREDSSNRDLRFRRNLMRHKVIPALVSAFPAARCSLARASRLLREDGAYLEAEAKRAEASLGVRKRGATLAVAVGPLRSLHVSLRRVLLREWIRVVLGDQIDVEEKHILAVDDLVMSRIPRSAVRGGLPRGLHAEVAHSRLALAAGRPAPTPCLEPAILQLPGDCRVPAGILEAVELPAPDPDLLRRMLAVCGSYHALLDADAIPPRLTVRSRSPGDRVAPVGMTGTRKLQDVMVDRKVPATLRDALPVLSWGDHVVWVPGLALDRRWAAGPGAARVMHVRFRPLPS